MTLLDGFEEFASDVQTGIGGITCFLLESHAGAVGTAGVSFAIVGTSGVPRINQSIVRMTVLQRKNMQVHDSPC